MRSRHWFTTCTFPFVLSILFLLPIAISYAAPLNSPPGAFSLVSPTSGVHIQSENITFVWHPSIDPDAGDQVTYDLVILINYSIAETLSVDLADTSITVSLSCGYYHGYAAMSYSWRIWAKDQWGNRTPSTQQWYFSNFPAGNADGFPPCAIPDISDAVFLITYIFFGGAAPDPI